MSEFTEMWRVKHDEPLNYNERIVNNACDIIEEQDKRIKDVCDLINTKGHVSKWKIYNWLKPVLKG